MGNAVTAIGGDLGTIAINPAGGSVSTFSQFSFSTGWNTVSSMSSYASSYDSYKESAIYSGGFADKKTRMTIPNIGMNLCFETGNRSGVLSWNFGFLVNRSQTYTQIFSATGLESHTSITGALATYADGMPGDILSKQNQMFDTDYAWNSICAYEGGLINFNSADGTYYGSAEKKSFDGTSYNYEMLGVLTQNVGVTTIGSKSDFIINYGANINDRLFIGANLGMPFANYKYNEYYAEKAQDSNDFPVTPEYYKDGAYYTATATKYVGSDYKYSYAASLSGINLKVGVIWLPTDGLRLGAAIQTPSAITVSEEWYVDMGASFEDESQNFSSKSPLAETSYNYTSPWSANFGLAYTLGRIGLISVDYELTDYSVMKFSQLYEDTAFSYEDPFYRVNRLNKLFCGVQNSLRIGAEIRVMPSISLRAGLNISGSPERWYDDNEGYQIYASDYDRWFDDFESGKFYLTGSPHKVPDQIMALSCGLGYSSPGSFYADVAIRRTTFPESVYRPYSNYLSHNVGGTVYDIVSPSVKSTFSQFDAVLTIGWRF